MSIEDARLYRKADYMEHCAILTFSSAQGFKAPRIFGVKHMVAFTAIARLHRFRFKLKLEAVLSITFCRWSGVLLNEPVDCRDEYIHAMKSAPPTPTSTP